MCLIYFYFISIYFYFIYISYIIFISYTLGYKMLKTRSIHYFFTTLVRNFFYCVKYPEERIVNYIDVKLSRHMRENSLTYARPHRNYPKKYIAIWQIARRGRHNPFYAPAIKSGSKNAISLLSIKQGWFLEMDECFFLNEIVENNFGETHSSKKFAF